MHNLIAWAVFAGAWLLVIGPVYQAILELDEEDAAMDRARAALSDLPLPRPVSRWWLLIPPVWYALRNHRSREYRALVRSSLSDEHYYALASYVNKATGWLYVGVGGCLIAIGETWGIVEEHEWPDLVFWLIVALMVSIALGHAMARRRRDERIRSARAARSAGGPQPS